MEQELDLYEIWQAMAKRWLMIVLIPLLAVAISGVYSIYALTPQYRSEARILVMKPTEAAQILYQDIQVSRQLVDTYREIVRDRRVLSKVVANLQLPYSTGQLAGKVEVDAVRNTEILAISATDPDPAKARDIANEVATVFMIEIVDIYQVENISVISSAVEPSGPFSPRIQLNVAVAFVVGLMAAVGMAFFFEYLDKTIKTPEDVQKHLDLPVLGIIPDMNGKN